MKKKDRTRRAKASALGRLLCRICGDEAGGVMMEYVILAVLIAAAVVVAVMYFGKNIKGGFNAMSQTVAGKSQTAKQTVTDMQNDLENQATASEDHRSAIADK